MCVKISNFIDEYSAVTNYAPNDRANVPPSKIQENEDLDKRIFVSKTQRISRPLPPCSRSNFIGLLLASFGDDTLRYIARIQTKSAFFPTPTPQGQGGFFFIGGKLQPDSNNVKNVRWSPVSMRPSASPSPPKWKWRAANEEDTQRQADAYQYPRESPKKIIQ